MANFVWNKDKTRLISLDNIIHINTKSLDPNGKTRLSAWETGLDQIEADYILGDFDSEAEAWEWARQHIPITDENMIVPF